MSQPIASVPTSSRNGTEVLARSEGPVDRGSISSSGTTGPGTTGLAMAVLVARLLLGFEFLGAFADKLFGLGYSTPSASSWINGASPTDGFLSHVAVGPFVDYHLIYAIAIIMIALSYAGTAWGLGVRWRQIPLVARHPVLW